MKSIKIKLCLILALALTFAALVGASVYGIVTRANRFVTLSGTTIFYTSGNAEIWAHREEHKTTGENGEDIDDPYYFTMFTFENDTDEVSYRRNLAYSWFYNMYDIGEESGDGENEDDSQTSSEAACAKGYFSMEIGFENLNFEKFIIALETQQYKMTEDKKTVNYIIFLPAGEDVKAVITSDKTVAEAKAEDIDVSESGVLGKDHIRISLSGGESGVYNVEVANAAGYGSGKCEGQFENVGKMYAKYVSSSSNSVTPLSFKADMPETDENNKSEVRACMALYEMNGQSFVLNRSSDGEAILNPTREINSVDDGGGKVHYTGGQVNDTMPPVLCLEKELRYVTKGNEIGFNYTAIDVLTQSPSLETGYFILTKEQAADNSFNANDFMSGVFRVVKDSDDQYITPHSNHYVPAETDYNKEYFDGFIPAAAIKIYLKLTDTSSTGGHTTYVMLDWFVSDEYKLNINDNNYIAVANDGEGAHYNNESADEWERLVEEYQIEVDKATEDLRAGKDDFYLPSLEKLISDNATAYSDMTYSIYYMVNGTKSSVTGKSASSLSIELSAAGNYLFTVYANDSSSNKMWYLKESETSDGSETVEFETSEIWDIYDDEELHCKLPWFTFTAGISEISIEDPGEQDTAYVGVSYTGSLFEINGVSTSEKYSLYSFDNELYRADNGELLTYKQFMERKQELFEGEGRKYFTNIIALSNLDEDSMDYEEFAKYSWNASSRSFVPQDENSFYLIKCEVTSTQFPAMEPVKAYMGIAASKSPRALDGEDTWLQDNMVSVILLSIAGVAFIGIILLLFIKPKEKGDVDEMYEKEVAAKDTKKKK